MLLRKNLPKNFHNLDKPEKQKHEKDNISCFFIFRLEITLDVSKNVSEIVWRNSRKTFKHLISCQQAAKIPGWQDYSTHWQYTQH